MKFFCIVGLLLISAKSAYAGECPIKDDIPQMYSLFFDTAYTKSNTEQDGYFARTPPKVDAAIAWSCLLKAAELNSCEAIHVLELYYRHGSGEKAFGIGIDLSKAEYYLKRKLQLCKK
ncbi:hypothetical protein N7931_17950 [Catenovulum sp. 2E275]|uniref:hypothetical protein n=1 Tax=Catenovulum sp. 2E275 TaxID=2980497 RepID=UPI0021D078BA|nr:hypothetical protein [Catenovulum sp. 2E275]MCU4677510.1 hypothetical protein [Catenovulum sp. 2E275]